MIEVETRTGIQVTVTFPITKKGPFQERVARDTTVGIDICKPMTREGYALHQEWTQGSTGWVSDGNPFLWVVQTMQFHMDNEYQGRAT
jgi:hypothetical protein